MSGQTRPEGPAAGVTAPGAAAHIQPPMSQQGPPPLCSSSA